MWSESLAVRRRRVNHWVMSLWSRTSSAAFRCAPCRTASGMTGVGGLALVGRRWWIASAALSSRARCSMECCCAGAGPTWCHRLESVVPDQQRSISLRSMPHCIRDDGRRWVGVSCPALVDRRKKVYLMKRLTKYATGFGGNGLRNCEIAVRISGAGSSYRCDRTTGAPIGDRG